MDRLYQPIIIEHFRQHRQMLFLAGPRQVGKTTISLACQAASQPFLYLNWDNEKHRQLLLEGEDAILAALNFHHLKMLQQTPLLVLDEFHKYAHWKQFLKGFYDIYQQQIKILVTGSAKLNVYQASGDSLLGRYLLYRIHPISIAEWLGKPFNHQDITAPQPINRKQLEQLLHYGGYPEPLLKHDPYFLKQWQKLRNQQLFREDMRDLSNIQDLARLELLAALLRQQAGQLINYSQLAKSIRVSVDTITRWLESLARIYYCFTLKPWSRNVKRSLLKEPKVYLWNWADIDDIGAKTENFVASHLLKAVQLWNDAGLGDYGLYFVRDKDKREVDFLVTKNEQPWFLVEVKHASNRHISANLHYFQQQLAIPYAFQVVFDAEYIDQDCFSIDRPMIVPVQTLLSQLV